MNVSIISKISACGEIVHRSEAKMCVHVVYSLVAITVKSVNKLV